jgi:serine/threonine-protein kinase
VAASVPPGQALTTSLSASGFAPAAAAPPARWGRWVLAGAVVLLAAAGGAFAYLALHPRPEPVPQPEPITGLPDIRSNQKLVAPRERELRTVLDARGTKGEEIVSASIELGLLYVRERRLDEAQARFEALERERLEGPLVTDAALHCGRFGKAIVMAYRDSDPKFPQAAKESLKLFTDAINSPVPKDVPGAVGPKVGGKVDRVQRFQNFLLRYPELAQAVAEALNRNAANLPVPKLAATLEPLRTPRTFPRKGGRE